MKVLEQGMHIY